MAEALSNYPVTVFDSDSRRGEVDMLGGLHNAHLINAKATSDTAIAVLINSNNNVLAQLRESSDLRREVAISAKDNEIRAERLERENQNRLRELETKVMEDGDKTRAILRADKCAELAAKIAELQAQIVKLTPVPTPTP